MIDVKNIDAVTVGETILDSLLSNEPQCVVATTREDDLVTLGTRAGSIQMSAGSPIRVLA